MDSDLFWHSLTGSALISVGLTVGRLLLEYALRAHQRSADARLEHILEDRLAEADRRFERSECELRAERERTATLEDRLRRVSARRGNRR